MQYGLNQFQSNASNSVSSFCCVVFKIFKLFGRKIESVCFFFYAVLEHIKANVSKQSDENEAVTKKLQDLLKSYEDKLKDLDKALKEANDSVKKANVQNGLNAQAMEDLKVHFLFFFPTTELL